MPAPKLIEQRKQAARLVAEGGRSFAEVARSVGVSERRFRVWRGEDWFVALVSEARRQIAYNERRRMLNAYAPDELVDDPITPADLKSADPFRGDPRTLPGRPPVLATEPRREISDAEAQARWLLDNDLRFGRISEREWEEAILDPQHPVRRLRRPEVQVSTGRPGRTTTGPRDPFAGEYAPRTGSGTDDPFSGLYGVPIP